MLKDLKNEINDIRYGDVKLRKKVFIAACVVCFLIVLILWLFVFGVRFVASEKQTASEGESVEFWGVLKNAVDYSKQAFTVSTGLLSSLPEAEQAELATTTVSAIPTPSFEPVQSPENTVIELH